MFSLAVHGELGKAIMLVIITITIDIFLLMVLI